MKEKLLPMNLELQRLLPNTIIMYPSKEKIIEAKTNPNVKIIMNGQAIVKLK